MAAYRIFSRLNTFYGLTGQLLAGGYLKFYTEETTTPKNVYGDEALSVNNGSQVDLDASGRPDEDIWGDGDYFVELYDSEDVKQGDMDNVAIYGSGGQTIPMLDPGEFLTGNGVVFQAETIIQVPDPTGQSGKILGNDGSGPLWQDPPDEPDPEIVVGANSFRAGVSTDDTKWLEQTGSSSAAAGGGKTATASVTFSTAYSVTPTFIDVVPTTASATGTANLIPHWAITTKSATGFTVTFSTLTGGSSADAFSGSNIISAVTFDWKATGTIEIAP